MDLDRKIEILSQLGTFFKASIEDEPGAVLNFSSDQIKDFKNKIHSAKHENAWFTSESVIMAINAWVNALHPDKIKTWLSSYDFVQKDKTTGVIMAGNIPMVGLHDALCVLLSEHHLKAKLSSKDRVLMNAVLEILQEIAPEFKGKINLDAKLNGIDNLIATGSDNSARYFDYYFKTANRIIRKNRTSVAVLNGSESEFDLENLALDIFSHFGLGCRNVTKLYLPQDFDLDRLFKVFYPYHHLTEHNKYSNNYDYNKAVYLLNKIELLENGFLLMKEDKSIHSPVAVLFYERYNDLELVINKLEEQKEQIQSVVSNIEALNPTPFGQAQLPELSQYADGVDTLQFLGQKLKA